MMKKAMLCLLMILSVFLLAACQKQPQPEIKLPEPQAAASPAQPGPETVEQTLTLGLIDFLVLGRDEHDRNVAGALRLLESAADVIAVHAGHDHVQQDEVRRGVACGQARGAQGKDQDHQQTQQGQQPSLVVSHGSLSLKQKSHGRRHDFPREEPTTALRPARGDSP